MFKQLFFGIKSIKNPIFYKEFNEYNKQLEELNELSCRVKSNKKLKIDKDIMCLRQGIAGERNVKYELENSFIPMLILHDVRIQEGDYVAQMDYILITYSFIMILETKKLNGDITINELGEFIRIFKNKRGQVVKREGIYSPISQNERHVRILDKVLKDNKIIKNVPILSGVVMANPKSIINRYKAPKNISQNIIKYDQLTDFINRKINEEKKNNSGEMFEEKMYKIADFLKENNIPISIDYEKKYSLDKEDIIEKSNKIEETKETSNEILEDIKEKEIDIEDNLKIEKDNLDEKLMQEDKIDKQSIGKEKSEIYIKAKENIILKGNKGNIKNTELILKELREYRYKRARLEKIPQYIIFTNVMLDEIMETLPKDIEGILNIRGFGEIKAEKYGRDIVDIINKNIS